MALTDKTLKKNKSSLLATINTNIHNRPIFFNYYRDFCVDFTCLMKTEALKLDVHIQGDGFCDFKNLAIMYRVYFLPMSPTLNAKFFNTLPLNTKERVLLQIEDENLMFLLQKFSNGMQLHFYKLLSLKTLDRLLFTNPDKWTILSKSEKNTMAEFSYGSSHFVNLLISLELLPVGNHFLISTQKELCLQWNHKNGHSSCLFQNQLSLILHLLLLQE